MKALVFCMLCNLTIQAQSFSTYINNEAVVSNLNEALSKYDSLFVYNQSGYWNCQFSLNGIGYIGNSTQGLRIEFCSSFNRADSLCIEKIKRVKLTKGEKVIPRPSELGMLKEDSLHITATKGKETTISISDADYYTLISLYPKSGGVRIVQIYNAPYYQGLYYVSDRERFISLFTSLQKLVPGEKGCR